MAARRPEISHFAPLGAILRSVVCGSAAVRPGNVNEVTWAEGDEGAPDDRVRRSSGGRPLRGARCPTGRRHLPGSQRRPTGARRPSSRRRAGDRRSDVAHRCAAASGADVRQCPLGRPTDHPRHRSRSRPAPRHRPAVPDPRTAPAHPPLGAGCLPARRAGVPAASRSLIGMLVIGERDAAAPARWPLALAVPTLLAAGTALLITRLRGNGPRHGPAAALVAGHDVAARAGVRRSAGCSSRCPPRCLRDDRRPGRDVGGRRGVRRGPGVACAGAW